MRALTLTQPWATLVAIGAKRIETRSWSTSYRGRIVIHAAKGFPKDAREFSKGVECYEAVMDYSTAEDKGRFLSGELAYPLGVVLASCHLWDVVPVEDVFANHRYPSWATKRELQFGDYSPGRYAWILTDVKRPPEPIPAKGALGLWEWEWQL